MKFVYGPLSEIPKFSIGIGYSVEFIPHEKEDIEAKEGFKNIGELYVLGPDVYSNEVYEKNGSYYLK